MKQQKLQEFFKTAFDSTTYAFDNNTQVTYTTTKNNYPVEIIRKRKHKTERECQLPRDPTNKNVNQIKISKKVLFINPQ